MEDIPFCGKFLSDINSGGTASGVGAGNVITGKMAATTAWAEGAFVLTRGVRTRCLGAGGRVAVERFADVRFWLLARFAMFASRSIRQIGHVINDRHTETVISGWTGIQFLV